MSTITKNIFEWNIVMDVVIIVIRPHNLNWGMVKIKKASTNAVMRPNYNHYNNIYWGQKGGSSLLKCSTALMPQENASLFNENYYFFRIHALLYEKRAKIWHFKFFCLNFDFSLRLTRTWWPSPNCKLRCLFRYILKLSLYILSRI